VNWRILHGDVREQLASLPDGCVQTCVTSPPYFGLRDYGHAGQIGLELTPDAYIHALSDVFMEVRRVLADDGTLWVNIGDSYAAHEGQRKVTDAAGPKQQTKRGSTGVASRHVEGLKAKDLIGIPWRLAFQLQTDGWYLRSDIIWSKPNPMPESVTDRPTKAHEYIFLLSKSQRYFYDSEAIQEGRADLRVTSGHKARATGERNAGGRTDGLTRPGGDMVMGDTRNKRSVWHVATQPYSGAHFATFPEALIEPCILAGCPVGGTVLDPFTGSGTTGAVAIRHQRNFIGCELNADYIALAEKRIGAVAPLFAEHIA
jgi:DNA modification methylase